MELKHPLVLMPLTPLRFSNMAAGCDQASATPAQPELQTLPAWGHDGIVQGDRLGIAVSWAGQANGDAFSTRGSRL